MTSRPWCRTRSRPDLPGRDGGLWTKHCGRRRYTQDQGYEEATAVVVVFSTCFIFIRPDTRCEVENKDCALSKSCSTSYIF